jgi:hypothetical protein
VDEQSTCLALNVKEPLKSMYNAAVPPDSTTSNLTWPSVAPSGMDVYNSTAIPGWKSSLLIAGLKSGTLIRFKLSTDGLSIAGDTIMYFRGRGRFRDVCVSPDGKKIYISTDNSGSTSGPTGGVTNTPANPGAILEFTYTGVPGPVVNPGLLVQESVDRNIIVYPNPANNFIAINNNGNAAKNYELISVNGIVLKHDNLKTGITKRISVADFTPGIYILKIYGNKGEVADVRKIVVVH